MRERFRPHYSTMSASSTHIFASSTPAVVRQLAGLSECDFARSLVMLRMLSLSPRKSRRGVSYFALQGHAVGSTGLSTISRAFRISCVACDSPPATAARTCLHLVVWSARPISADARVGAAAGLIRQYRDKSRYETDQRVVRMKLVMTTSPTSLP